MKPKEYRKEDDFAWRSMFVGLFEIDKAYFGMNVSELYAKILNTNETADSMQA